MMIVCLVFHVLVPVLQEMHRIWQRSLNFWRTATTYVMIGMIPHTKNIGTVFVQRL